MVQIKPRAATVQAAQDEAARAVREWARAAEHSGSVWTMEAMAAEAAAKKAAMRAVRRADAMQKAAA